MSSDDANPSGVGVPVRPTQLVAKTLNGVTWTYTATICSAVLQVVFAAIMGRLLAPEAFGLIAISHLVLNFGTYFARMGVGQALIQKAHLSSEELRAGFTSSVGLGGLIAALTWAAAPLAVAVFDEPEVVGVLRAMGLSLLLSGLGLTSHSLLRRELRFRETAIISMLSYSVGYFGVGLGMAAAGAGVWSLVGAALAQAGLMSVLSYARARHALTPTFDRDHYRPLYGFGSRVSVISFLEFLGQNLDTFMVGRYAGTALLGQYNRAYVLVNLPLNQLMTSLSGVLFPSFSQIQREPERVKRAYIGAVSVASAVLLPLCAGMAVASEEIVRVVLGDQWEAVIGILPLLALAGTFKVLTHFAAIVCEAQGELGKKLVLQSVFLVVLLLLLLPARGRGLAAYALAFAVGKVFQHGAYMALMNRLFGITMREYARVYGRAVAATGWTAAVIFSGRQLLLAVAAPLVVVLVVEVLLGAVTLLALLRIGVLRPLAVELHERLAQAGVRTSGGGALSRGVGLILGAPPRARSPRAGRRR